MLSERHDLDRTRPTLNFKQAVEVGAGVAAKALEQLKQDVQVADLRGADEVWVSGDWADRLGVPRGPEDFGFGDGPAEVASLHGTTVQPHKQGRFGELPSEYATPLALALTEIVTNAVEHGLAGREGEVIITAERNETRLAVEVVDTGTGLPGGTVGDGLGTQIVRTLVEGELGGSIIWGPDARGGTRVFIDVPLRWIGAAA